MQSKKFFKSPIVTFRMSCFTLVFLFISGLASAGDERMNTRIDGSQIIAGAYFVASDSKFPNLDLSGTAIIKKSTGRVTLGLDHSATTLNYFATPNFYMKVGVQILYYGTSGSQSTITKDLIIDHKPTGISSEKFDVVVKDAHVLAVKVLYIKDISGAAYAGVTPNNLYLEGEIVTERYYEMDPTTAPTANHYYLSASNELQVYWSTLAGVEEYELEYTFVNNFNTLSNSNTPYDYEAILGANVVTLSNSSLDLTFNNNATRIRTKMNSFNISMNFERGLLAYRVRAIGRATTSLADSESELIGKWSYDQPQTTLKIPFNTFSSAVNDYTVIGSSIAAHDEYKNWQLSTTFAEDGKKKEVIKYFDGSLRNRQTVTRNNTEHVALVGESVYDSQGRPAVSILPAPSSAYSPLLQFYVDFNLSITNVMSSVHRPYSRVDFEAAPGGSCPVPADGLWASASSDGASRYYSPYNSDKENQNAYLPDAEEYPFTHSVYTPDNTGRIKYQTGVGKEHRIGNGHETKYLYGDCEEGELDRLFGSEAGDYNRYKKNSVIDPNGQISVSYLNTEGKLVATALAGNAPANVDQLPSLTVSNRSSQYVNYNDVNYPTVNVASNGALMFKKKIIPDLTGPYTFFYDITAPQFTDPGCIPGFCYDCIYDLQITLKDECNNTVYTTTTEVGSVLSLDYSCGSPVYFTTSGYSPAFTSTLTAGKEYFLTKMLTINNDALESYLLHYIDTTNNVCLEKIWQFRATEVSNIDFTGCGMTCDACSLKVEQYALAHNNPALDDYMTPDQKALAIKKCMKPCEPVSLCRAQFETMLVDVRPQGQYGQYSIDQYGFYVSNAEHELSVLNRDNYLRPTTIFGGPTSGAGTPFVNYDITKMALWTNPEFYNEATHNFTSPDVNATKDHYFNEDGSVSKFRLILANGGFYPLVTNTTVTSNTLIPGVYLDSQGYWTYPENLYELKDFVIAYLNNPYWAYSLVKNHPEFNYFLDCDRQSNPAHGVLGYTSEQFDADLRKASTFDEAEGITGTINAGYIKWPSLVQSPANDPSLDLILGDPYFGGTAGSSLIAAFSGRISNFRGSGKSIKEIAAEMYTTNNMYYSGCTATFGATSIGCIASIPTNALDDMWRAYREMYLMEKQMFILETAHKEAAQPTNTLQNNYFNGAIGDQNFAVWPAYQQFGFNPFLISVPGDPIYFILALANVYGDPAYWPFYPLSHSGAGTGAVFQPPYGTGYFDFGSPSSYYHRARYTKKIRRVPDMQTLSNKLAGGATDMAEIMINAQKKAEATMYFTTGQCPIFKQLESFLAALAKNGSFSTPYGTKVPLKFIPAFTKDLYDAFLVCSGYTGGNWYDLEVQFNPVSPTQTKIEFYDNTSSYLAGSDIELNHPSGINWSDFKSFSNIKSMPTLGSPGAFSIKGYYETGATNGLVDFTGQSCIQNNCSGLRDDINAKQCAITPQALAVQEFLSAVVNDNTTLSLGGSWINLGDYQNYNSPNYFTNLVKYPFALANVGVSPVTHSVSVVSPFDVIHIEGKDAGGTGMQVEFVFTPLSGVGNQDLAGALALGNIEANQTGSSTYDFIITAYYALGATQKFWVKINYTPNINFNSSFRKRYVIGNCENFVPLQCEGNDNYKTKLQTKYLLNEIFKGYSISTNHEINKLVQMSNLLHMQFGSHVNNFKWEVTSASAPASTYDHTVTVKLMHIQLITYVYCAITLTLNNSLSNVAMTANVPSWYVEDISPDAALTSAFTATINNGISSFTVSGTAPCLKMQNCEPCSSTTLVTEDFESYNTGNFTSQTNFTTERYDQNASLGPTNCNLIGFNLASMGSSPPVNFTTFGDSYIMNASGVVGYSDHTPGATANQFLLVDCFHPQTCSGISWPAYIIPWQTNGPITTNLGKKYVFSAHFKKDPEQVAEVQLLVNDGTTETILAKRSINEWSHFTKDTWENLSGSYFATSTNLTFKIKIVPYDGTDQCTGTTTTTGLYRLMSFDDITIREEYCENDDIIPIVDNSTPNDDCFDELMNIAKSNAKRKYEDYMVKLKEDFRKRYTEKCYETMEQLKADYQSSEGHYTLYYYDQAGNLIKTIPPEGVEPIDLSAVDPVYGLTYGDMIKNDRANKTHLVLTNHRMATRYEYNSLNQLIRQQMPDHANSELFSSNALTTLPGVNVKAMDFSNANQGYLIGTNGGNQELYVTGDGGSTWSPAALNTAANIIDVDYCANTGEAFAIVSDGSLLRSTNYSGGSPTWQILNLPGGNTLQFTDIQFVPASGSPIGMITGKNGLFMLTTDNGNTWFTINLNTSSDLNHIDVKANGGSLYGVIVGNNGVIYHNYVANNFYLWQAYNQVNANVDLLSCTIVGPGSGMNIVVSGVDKNLSPNRGTVLNITNVNGGGTSVISNLYLHSSSSYSSRIEALESNRYGTSPVYTDLVFGGVENSPTPTNILVKLQAVSAAPYANVPLTIGGSPAMEGVKNLTIDSRGTSGAIIFGVSKNSKYFTLASNVVTPNHISISGTPITTGSSRLNFFPASTTNGLIVGDAGNIIKFATSGPAFTSQSKITLPTLNALRAAKDGSGKVYSVGNSGAVVYSTNFGNSWQITSIGGAHLQAVEYLSTTPQKIVVAGASGYVAEALASNLASSQALNVANASDTYYSISTPVNDLGTIFVAGDNSSNAKIYKYSSGTPIVGSGVSLSNISVSGPSLYRIAFTTNNVAWAVGNTGTILKSTDNGVSFSSQTSGTTCAFSELLVIDPNTAYAFGPSAVFKTTDGANWNSKTSPSSNITTVHYFGNGKLIGGGSGTTNLFKLTDQSGDYASRFYYDQVGRLIISQDAKQFNKSPKAYSYTNFDALGRITEVGEVADGSMADPSTLAGSGSGVIATAAYNSWLASGTKSEVTTTVYDEDASAPCGFVQENLRKRVSAVYIDTDDNLGNGYTHATYYSYDIHGSVNRLLQENPSMPGGHTCKVMSYEYDLLSGKVNGVNYQEGEPDAFHHKYEYDADNRITNVYTSKDKVSWSQDAKYFYYLHGPLARVEIGKDKVQGLDYAYTIQGWIKGINSVMLNKNNDIGKDGLAGSQYNSGIADLHKAFAGDAAAYALNYFAYSSGGGNINDYTAIDASKNSSGSRFDADISGQSHFTSSNSLWNGNIMAMATTIYSGPVASSSPLPQLATYKYDQMNRIKAMESSISFGTNAWTGSPSATDYKNEFSYDANGNILSQKTNDNTGSAVDDMTYHYLLDGNGKAISNRLYHVNDQVSSGFVNYDIDDQGTYGSVPNNYDYDAIGNLTQDLQEEIASIEWNVYGKIQSINRDIGSTKENLIFEYDAAGNRISKTKYTNANAGNTAKYISTYYVRDAQGNVMATYDHKQNPSTMSGARALSLVEHPIYGSSRLGLRNYPGWDNAGAGSAYVTAGTSYTLALDAGNVSYELSNHLGNVLSVTSDRKLPVEDGSNPGTVDYYQPDLLAATDYYAFGSPMPGRQYNNGNYRYGFNGKEKDDEVKGSGNSIDFGARIYDPRLGRFLSVDPDAQKYPYASPYNYAANCPIRLVDINGKGPGDVMQGFAAAMADYATGGLTNFRNWTEVKPENAADYNKGLQIADALMVALATAEIAGGGGAAAGGLMTMEAGVATLVVPGVGEVTFVVAEVGGGAIALVGTLVAGHGAVMLNMANENLENQNGYRKENPKKQAREEAKKKREEQPASEDYAKHKAKQKEKAEGKDARRESHDKKEKGAPDRTKKQLDEDYETK